MDRYDCTMWSYLKESSSNITLDHRFSISEILFKVVLYIQNSGFCHLDLKPSNIFMNLTNRKTWDGSTLKIGDFGLSRKKTELSGRMGTPGFGSPNSSKVTRQKRATISHSEESLFWCLTRGKQLGT